MMAGLARFFEEIIASTLNVMCFCISDDFERLCNYKRVKRVKNGAKKTYLKADNSSCSLSSENYSLFSPS